MEPLSLQANRPPKFYRGGDQGDSFRGDQPSALAAAFFTPEDWIASTVSCHGTETQGLTRLPDGRLLRDAMAADPGTYFEPAHVQRFGADPGLLVKLLDTGERLPAHCHPSREFARTQLGCRFGKTEAWVIVGTSTSDPHVYLGFNRDVAAGELEEWFERQDHDVILQAMNRLPVSAGDTVYVPAGTPHSIGAGLFIVEIQEPTDFSVMLEWRDFGLDECRHGQLGMTLQQSLACFNRWRVTPQDVAMFHGHARPSQVGISSLLPESALSFFQAEEVMVETSCRLSAGYSILIVLEGAGVLETAASRTELARGSTILIPYSAGPTTVRGRLRAVRCLPSA
jgi:mannose-6-phosphate isomerase